MLLKLTLAAVLAFYATTGFSQKKVHIINSSGDMVPTDEFDQGRKKFVKRHLLLNDKESDLLRPPALETSLVNIMLAGLQSGAIKAYSSVDSMVLSWNQISDMISADTNTNSLVLAPDKVDKFYITEEWEFDSKKGRIIVRITSIAPIIRVKDGDSTFKEIPAFWLPYKESRKYLAAQKVKAPAKDDIANLEDVFSTRRFRSEVIK